MSGSPVRAFRPPAPEEAAGLVDLWAESWSEVYAAIDFAARKDWFAGHLAAWTASGGDWICAFGPDERPAGFILLDRRSGLLDQICVRRDLKGAGAAEALLAEARRLSPAGIELEVNAMNGRAIRFYEREGFVRIGEGVNQTSGLPTFRYRWRP